MVEMQTGAFVGMIIAVVIFVVIAAALVTFFIAKRMFEKQLRENPPINEKMIRVMFKQMGRTASETQIRQIMKSMNAEKNKK
ncbi:MULTISPECIES: YneF family protein [unclassified Mycoplasma]|uniref:YneF family protein n=1 Tax=unclassified Mycoplasma TaxID=2683645 RepID=UPI002B1E1EAF|nr:MULTISPECIES: YneF family protein [unclassified Mycoplasma]MEA4162414.1 YneF family protein [Mycoplasma sp. 4404]MEA4191091.1 YneF family protein [Mycoplasma sp. 2248]MEA4206002.1 YneF family protein [Mycoplasma sp. 1199]MEA4276210.1 YneF family protein [Mycoplasma sp. 21DD0573]MEA4333490.1 YneF family protein [Mycoplasma sp. 1232]